MNTIYTISPHYLDAILKETKDYLFTIQGYRDIALAINALQTVNTKNIYGYLYMADELPRYEDMLEFIRRIDLMGGDKQLLIVIKDVEDFENFRQFYKGSKTKVKVIKGFEVMTDIVIKRAIGDTLKSQLEPYMSEEPEKIKRIEPHKYLEYKPVIDKKLMRILEPIRNVNDNLADTLKYDAFLQSGIKEGHLTYKLRKAYISAHFGVQYDLSSAYNTKNDELYMMVRSIETIAKEVCKNERKTK
ncbi:hypothetical protein UT300012_23840 [Paraclostridium bifermentans]